MEKTEKTTIEERGESKEAVKIISTTELVRSVDSIMSEIESLESSIKDSQAKIEKLKGYL